MWLLIMMGYIFVASIAPVWILLQPRDYLNSFLLYLMIIAAFLGICFYQPTMEISPFVGFDLGHGQWLFPGSVRYCCLRCDFRLPFSG